MKKVAILVGLVFMLSSTGVASAPSEAVVQTGDSATSTNAWRCDPLMRFLGMCKSSENLLEDTK